MHFSNKLFMAMVGLALALAVAMNLPQMAAKAEAADDLDRAMQAFIQAMQSRNSQGGLAAFSRTAPWRYVVYEQHELKQFTQKTVTYAEMARDFKARIGWYQYFLIDREWGCNIREEFRPGMKWHRRGTTFVRHPDDPKVFYLKWRQEGSKWVIAEFGGNIGD